MDKVSLQDIVNGYEATKGYIYAVNKKISMEMSMASSSIHRGYVSLICSDNTRQYERKINLYKWLPSDNLQERMMQFITWFLQGANNNDDLHFEDSNDWEVMDSDTSPEMMNFFREQQQKNTNDRHIQHF